ncbi:MAG: ribonuclease P protein component [Candidatus Symbiobacter sp.]|nr:ribonuclease P protein component [Candidatus Symbiobacter sp.]
MSEHVPLTRTRAAKLAAGDRIGQKRLPRMKKRSEFQRLTAQGAKHFSPSLVIQIAPALMTPALAVSSESDLSPDGRASAPGPSYPVGKLGLTASRKVGNAVMRNRAKRRLRAASDLVMSNPSMRRDCDVVLVARTETTSRPWRDLLADLESGLRKLHALA